LPVVWYAAAYPRGVLMARLDHARGRYQVLPYGPCGQDWDEGSARLLGERYGVEWDADTPGGWLPWQRWYTEGYNSTSLRRLEEKYGKDIFRECDDEARQRWEAE
jgi:hypothetical protein